LLADLAEDVHSVSFYVVVENNAIGASNAQLLFHWATSSNALMVALPNVSVTILAPNEDGPTSVAGLHTAPTDQNGSTALLAHVDIGSDIPCHLAVADTSTVHILTILHRLELWFRMSLRFGVVHKIYGVPWL
jgi:hypothetical protein